METILAPEPTANLFSSGDQRTQVAARLILRNEKSDKSPQQPDISAKQKLSRMLPEKYKSVLPGAVILFHPNIGVPIRRAGHYPAVGKVDYKQWIHHRFLVIDEHRLSSPVRLGSPIYAGDSEIMLVQFPIFFEPLSIGRIQLHLIEWLTVTFLDKTKNLFGVSRESKLFPIP